MRYIISILMVLTLVSPARSIKVSRPAGGYIRNKVFNFLVQDTPYLMKINYNGIPFIAKGRGSFSRTMLASRGLNTISISDMTNLNISDSVTFYADVPPTSMKIILFWDTDNTDMDMHVIEPDKSECYYSYKNTKLGGKLDIDVTTGYGPEIYTMEYPNKGVYEIFVHFYGGQELSECTVVVIMNEGTSKESRETFKLMLTKKGEKIYVGKVELK